MSQKSRTHELRNKQFGKNDTPELWEIDLERSVYLYHFVRSLELSDFVFLLWTVVALQWGLSTKVCLLFVLSAWVAWAFLIVADWFFVSVVSMITPGQHVNQA